MTELRLLTDEEVAQADLLYQQSLAEYQEHKRLVDACGQHDWELHLELDDDDGGFAALHCTRCPAGVDDVCHSCGGFNETGTRYCSTECEADAADRLAEIEAHVLGQCPYLDSYDLTEPCDCRDLLEDDPFWGRSDEEDDEWLR